MQLQIERNVPAQSALIHIEPGEMFVSVAGSMFRTSDNVAFSVKRFPRPSHGLLDDVKHLFSGSDFMLSCYTTTDDLPGTIGLLARPEGTLRQGTLECGSSWLCDTAAFVGATSEIQVGVPLDPPASLANTGSESVLRLAGNGKFLVQAISNILVIHVRDRCSVRAEQWLASEEKLVLTAEPMDGPKDTTILHFSGVGRLLVRSPENSSTHIS